MRRVKEAVPMPECKERALSGMRELHKRYRRIKASQVAIFIWPDTEFKAQGAGASASRILKDLERDGEVRWSSTGQDWGWVLSDVRFDW